MGNIITLRKHTGPHDTKWGHMGPYMTIHNQTGPYLIMQDHTNVIIYDHTGDIQDHTGPYGTIRAIEDHKDQTETYWTIQYHMGQYVTIRDHIWDHTGPK